MNLEFVDALFTSFKASNVGSYAFNGIRVLAVLLFLVNILKKYNERITTNDGYTWGLTPDVLAKNVMVVLLAVFSPQILGFLDAILVSIESGFRGIAPDLQPLTFNEITLDDDTSGGDLLDLLSAMIDYFTIAFFQIEVWTEIFAFVVWFLDLFIYPLFLAERFFLLGILQVFFPLVISLSVYDKLRPLAYNFFKLYTAVYMLVPAFFLVNVFANNLYVELNTNFFNNLFGVNINGDYLVLLSRAGTIGFIFFLKLKLYKRSSTFVFRIFQ